MSDRPEKSINETESVTSNVLRGRPWSWITGRPRLVDGLLVTFVLVGGVAGLVADYRRLRLPILVAGVILVLLQALPLWWRRRRPILVLGIVLAAVLIEQALGTSVNLSRGAIVFAAYAASVYGRSPERGWVAAGAIAVVATGLLARSGAIPMVPFGLPERAGNLTEIGATSLVAWVIGDYFHTRRRQFSEMMVESRREAAQEERLRIARELHDVVAHNVSAIALQAGAARIGGGDGKPEVLTTIETTARDTLAELNRLLGVLRKPSEEALLAPQPGLAAVEGLLTVARGAGLEAHLRVTGEPRPLPVALDLSAYRVIQEAVTNAVRHAHASRIDVHIDYRPEAVLITVSDNGAGASAEQIAAATGHGLVGMRERVAIFGGELDTLAPQGGGFRVRARLPLTR